jgi:hypothetical protein
MPAHTEPSLAVSTGYRSRQPVKGEAVPSSSSLLHVEIAKPEVATSSLEGSTNGKLNAGRLTLTYREAVSAIRAGVLYG